MTASYLKLALLKYWRYSRQYCCCTELTIATNNICDVCAYDFTDTFIDCEVKITKSDLLNDVKKIKHSKYRDNPTSFGSKLPNKFYYCVPQELVTEAVEQCKVINPSYGVICIKHRYGVETVRRASKLYTGIDGNNAQKLILKRLNSEIITLYQKQLKPKPY